MSKLDSRSRLGPAVVGTLACAAALLAPAASAKPVTVKLRVEGTDRALAGGETYATDTVKVRSDPGAKCQGEGTGGTGRTTAVRGATALGVLQDATRADRDVRPLSATDAFGFGLFVCGIGVVKASGGAFWWLKVNHADSQTAGDLTRLHQGDEVLWVLRDPNRGTNMGSELALAAPFAAMPGVPFGVTVFAYDGNGRQVPAAGATVTADGQSVVADAQGRATLTLGPGAPTLRATRGADIPSRSPFVCIDPDPARCPLVRGRKIFGSKAADFLRGTQGPDQIYAGAGNDRVSGGGGADVIRCGRGRDRVGAAKTARVSRDCEKVKRS